MNPNYLLSPLIQRSLETFTTYEWWRWYKITNRASSGKVATSLNQVILSSKPSTFESRKPLVSKPRIVCTFIRLSKIFHMYMSLHPLFDVSTVVMVTINKKVLCIDCCKG